jgi:hypothetical protein
VKKIPSKVRGRPPLEDLDLVDEIEMTIGDMPVCSHMDISAFAPSCAATPVLKGVRGRTLNLSTR